MTLHPLAQIHCEAAFETGEAVDSGIHSSVLPIHGKYARDTAGVVSGSDPWRFPGAANLLGCWCMDGLARVGSVVHCVEWDGHGHPCSSEVACCTVVLLQVSVQYQGSQSSASSPFGAKDGTLELLIMENFFYGRTVHRVYDLKGSERDRYAVDDPKTSGEDEAAGSLGSFGLCSFGCGE